MSPKELALSYMQIFYSGQNLELLYDILDKDFHFEGPYYKFESAEEYINSLKNDPPRDMSFQLLYIFENETSVNLIYEFKKQNISALMSQLFEIKDEHICKSILIFDTSVF